MKNHISVVCKKEDFETSRYLNRHDCALARALKRFGFDDLEVQGQTVQTGLVEYGIVEYRDVVGGYDDPRDIQVNLLLI